MRHIRLNVLTSVVGVVPRHDGKDVIYVIVFFLLRFAVLRPREELVLGLCWILICFNEGNFLSHPGTLDETFISARVFRQKVDCWSLQIL